MASPAFQPPPPPALDAYNQPLPPPLSLKVMRLSRPSLAHAGSQQLFFEVPPGGSEVDGSEPLIALERRARMSLDNVGKLPEASSEVLSSQAGMRDFPLGPLLVLPGSFGSICLGETFVAAINLSNDFSKPVPAVRLHVELQTATAKIPLADERGLDATGGGIDPGQALGTTVRWEIKELGLHMLSCEVFWGLEGRSFKKVYKFQVTNPLSVKTKVHIPSTPTTALSPSLRHKVLLELHIQNTSSLPLVFARCDFQPVQGLTGRPLHEINQESGSSSSCQEAAPVLNVGDTRQVCFEVDETGREGNVGGMKKVWEGGTVLPLGRMDIQWTTAYGEPGRLQTSVLHRRVPAPPTVPSVILHEPPSHSSGASPAPLVRSASSGSSFAVRSPPASPAKGGGQSLKRSSTTANSNTRSPYHSQGGSLPGTPPPPPPPPKDPRVPLSEKDDEWEVDLVVLDRVAGHTEVIAEEPFSVRVQILARLIKTAPIPAAVTTPAADNEEEGSTAPPPPPPSARKHTASFTLHHLPQPDAFSSSAAKSFLLPMGSSVLPFELSVDAEGTVVTKEWTFDYVPWKGGMATLAGVAVARRSSGESSGSERELRRWEELGDLWVE